MKFKFFKLSKSEGAGATPQKDKRALIKTDRQIITLLGVVFFIFVVLLLCYWFFKEKPYYEKLISQKDEQIEKLKYIYEKQKKIFENKLDTKMKEFKERLNNNYIQKSLHNETVELYKQKLTDYEENFMPKKEHERQIEELKTEFEDKSSLNTSEMKEGYEEKITRLEQKLAILKNKKYNLTKQLEKSTDFIKKEKEVLESKLIIERKEALIPSLILDEIQKNTLDSSVLKKLVDIKEKLENIEEMNITLNPDTYFEMGLISYYNGEYNKAIEQWENAVSLNKNNFNAYLCLGILYNKRNMTENAILILKRAIDLNPNYATLHLALARIYDKKERLDEAIYEYSKVLEIYPEDIEILNKLGELYEKKGMKEEAEKAFARCEKIKNEKVQ